MGFIDVIDRWPSVRELAEDLGVPADRVWKWRQRNSIPPEHWIDLIAAARKRRISGVSAESLAKAASKADAAA